MSVCNDLHAEHSTAWSQAVSHPFLEACRDGTLDLKAFDTWLVQDYLFVLEFARFMALAITKAPYRHFHTLLGGIIALEDELSWFQGCMATRGINLEEEVARAPCQEYIDYMHSCHDQPYPIHVTVLWAIEKAYHEAWHAHQPSQPNQAPYDYATERWASEPFSKYVKELQAVADDALASATRDERNAAQAAFINVCRLERDFWAMAYEA